MVLNPRSNNTSSQGCNSGRCISCAMSLVCSKSPYCVLDGEQQNIDFISILKGTPESIYENLLSMKSGLDNNTLAIASLLELDSNSYNSLATKIDLLGDQISLLSHSIQGVNDRFNAIDEKLDLILSKFTESEYIPQNGELMNASGEESGIVPYSTLANDSPVLVEKKTLFGKSKWVEQKK